MERRQFLQSMGLGAAATLLGIAPLTAATTELSFPKENVMSENPHPYEPLTSENAALILVDHQVGLMTGVRDYSTGELKHNVVGLAKAAKVSSLASPLKSVGRSLPSLLLAEASTLTWRWTPPVLSARPNDRPGFYACSKPA